MTKPGSGGEAALSVPFARIRLDLSAVDDVSGGFSAFSRFYSDGLPANDTPVQNANNACRKKAGLSGLKLGDRFFVGTVARVPPELDPNTVSLCIGESFDFNDGWIRNFFGGARKQRHLVGRSDKRTGVKDSSMFIRHRLPAGFRPGRPRSATDANQTGPEADAGRRI